MTNANQIQRRLLFILHRAWVEARLLAQSGESQQLYDLADAMEPIPRWLAAWKDENLSEAEANLESYRRKYPHSFAYSDYIARYDPPASF